MKKKSGLADSPFFTSQAEQSTAPTPLETEKRSSQETRPRAHVTESNTESHIPSITASHTESNNANDTTSHTASNTASNIAILQFDGEDISSLRDSTYKAATFRLTEVEDEWLKDTAYQLSKEVKRGKVWQADIVRIGVKLFQKMLATNKVDMIKILEELK
jgi:hypothetical protein